MTLTSLNVCVDSSIRSLFGCLVSWGSVESLTIAMVRCNKVACALENTLVVLEKGGVYWR